MARRLHYIDWLRVLAVLLLFPFHTSRVFNFGEDFYVKGTHLSIALGYVLGFISTWHMQLLFLLAGASVFFSMRRRTGGEFARERVGRLLVPFVFGVFVLVPPQTWIGAQFNSGYTGSFIQYLTSGDFFRFDISDYFGGFGFGHLWFILFLLLMSLVAMPLFVWGRTERGAATIGRVARFLAKPWGWLVVAFVILIGEAMPTIGDKNLIYYLVFFVLGYIAMFDDAFMESAERYRWFALIVGMLGCAIWVATGPFRDSLPDPSLPLFGLVMAGMLSAWLAIIGLLGMGKRYLDRPSPALAYLAESSYPVYILHQTVIVVAAFYLVRMQGPLPLEWTAVFTVSVLATFALYEIVRRVPALRTLFGMRPLPVKASVEPELPEVDQPELGG